MSNRQGSWASSASKIPDCGLALIRWSTHALADSARRQGSGQGPDTRPGSENVVEVCAVEDADPEISLAEGSFLPGGTPGQRACVCHCATHAATRSLGHPTLTAARWHSCQT